MSTEDVDDGFLGYDHSKISQRIRSTNNSWYVLARAINNAAVRMTSEINAEKDSLRPVLSLSLIARILENLQGSIILLEIGMQRQSDIVLRAALEGIFILGAIARDPSYAEKYRDSDSADQLRIFRKVEQLKDPVVKGLWTTSFWRTRVEQLEKDNASAVDFFDAARRAELSDNYITIYSFLCSAAHTHVRHLDQHHAHVENGNLAAILAFHPTFEGLERSYSLCCDLLISVVRFAGQIFAIDSDSWIKNLAKAYETLCQGQLQRSSVETAPNDCARQKQSDSDPSSRSNEQ